ncbi:MAG TPA: L,D-transpeptidase [Terriglobales bacterium]|nr:L,D-transpeptidase [Terriglobales bacterium]
MRRLVETSIQISKAVLAVTLLSLFSGAALAQDAKRAPQQANTADKPARTVIVSIPDRKLALVEGGRTLRVYPVAVGAAESPSPEGEFKIVNRVENPTFYKPGTVIEPGKDNPLGTRWIGLNLKGYGIHGTNVPTSIGKAASHGCIRMRQSDLEELFLMLREGDAVQIRAERDEQLAKVMTVELVVTATAADEPIEIEEPARN